MHDAMQLAIDNRAWQAPTDSPLNLGHHTTTASTNPDLPWLAYQLSLKGNVRPLLC